jgi:hypothetical protein
MVKQLETPTPAKGAGAVEAADLSAEIAAHVEREPADRVSCRRVHGSHYRCNWWAPATGKEYDNPAMYGLTVTTHRVRKSQFMCVTRTTNGLTIRAM